MNPREPLSNAAGVSRALDVLEHASDAGRRENAARRLNAMSDALLLSLPLGVRARLATQAHQLAAYEEV